MDISKFYDNILPEFDNYPLYDDCLLNKVATIINNLAGCKRAVNHCNGVLLDGRNLLKKKIILEISTLKSTSTLDCVKDTFLKIATFKRDKFTDFAISVAYASYTPDNETIISATAKNNIIFLVNDTKRVIYTSGSTVEYSKPGGKRVQLRPLLNLGIEDINTNNYESVLDFYTKVKANAPHMLKIFKEMNITEDFIILRLSSESNRVVSLGNSDWLELKDFLNSNFNGMSITNHDISANSVPFKKGLIRDLIVNKDVNHRFSLLYKLIEVQSPLSKHIKATISETAYTSIKNDFKKNAPYLKQI